MLYRYIYLFDVAIAVDNLFYAKSYGLNTIKSCTSLLVNK